MDQDIEFMDDYETKEKSKKSKHRVRVSITNVDFEPDQILEDQEEEYYDDSDDNILEKLRQKSINESKNRLNVEAKDGHTRGVSWGTVTRIELDYAIDSETAKNTFANRPELDKNAVSHPISILQNKYSSSSISSSSSPKSALSKKKGKKVRMQLKPIASEGYNRQKNDKNDKTNKNNKIDKDKDFLGGIGNVYIYID